MRSIYILIGFAFLFSACSTTVPAVVKYKISSSIELDKQKDTTCRSQVVKVASAFTSSDLMSKDMSYVQGASKVYEYSESAWLNNPNQSVTRELIKMLRGIGVYKSVQDSKSRSKSDLISESILEEFIQYYSEDLKDSYAVVKLNISVIDSKSYELVSAKTFDSRVDAKTLDAKGGVKALNSALKNVLNESSKWFIEGCK